MRRSLIAMLGVTMSLSCSAAFAGGLETDSDDKRVKVEQRSQKIKATKKYTYRVRKSSDTGPGREIRTDGSGGNPCPRDTFCAVQLLEDSFRAVPPPPSQEYWVVTMSSETAAQVAVAEMQLPEVKPGIGPDPSINRWKMAAVGYPLWLWADGPTHLGPISQRVGDLFVSLDAELTGVTYRMGDGHTVECKGAGQKWTRDVRPGWVGDCGYRYTRPSLPSGSYTVEAISHWDIAWTVGGSSGTITMDQEGSRQLPVGELQALVR